VTLADSLYPRKHYSELCPLSVAYMLMGHTHDSLHYSSLSLVIMTLMDFIILPYEA